MENKINSIYVKMIEEAWGKPSYSSGLDLFKQSHASTDADNKVKSSDLTITSLDEVLTITSLDEVLGEMLKTNKSE